MKNYRLPTKLIFPKYEKYLQIKTSGNNDAMPRQLNQKNKRFQLNSIGKGISYDRSRQHFLWLKDAGVAQVRQRL